jgi:tRNA-2-methylthio-N6-dimethylallyladenosine synthase
VARSYKVETFGCQMNHHDAERLAGLLDQAGYEPAEVGAPADLIVLNTCSVREKAEEKLYSRLGELRELAKAAGTTPTIAVTGCVAQQEGDTLLKRNAGIDLVIGTQALKRLPELVEEAVATRSRRVDINPYEDVSFPLGVVRHSDSFRALVTIIEGCNEFCAFCVVPYTRGHERMRPAADILDEVRAAADSGRVEVQLLGQIVNHYQAPDDPSCDFATLLRRVAAVPGIRRVRFASPHPRHVTTPLIEAMRETSAICRHFHLPVQSGSTRMLEAMRRRHTREDYLALVERITAALPDVTLSTDLIVGFPGESVRDFEDTLDLLRLVRYHYVFSFKYSPRPNTLAAKRMTDDVPESEKTRRIVALQQLQRELQWSRHRDAVGRCEEVLIDSVSRRRTTELAGRTSGNLVVNLPGPESWIGRIVQVRITDAGPNSLRGEALLSDEVQTTC